MKRTRSSKRKLIKTPGQFAEINQCAAGIDIGSKSHFVAVPVREFLSFTADLERMAE